MTSPRHWSLSIFNLGLKPSVWVASVWEQKVQSHRGTKLLVVIFQRNFNLLYSEENDRGAG